MLGVLLNKYRKKRQRINAIGSIGMGTVIESTALFEHHASLEIGAYCRIGPRCFISAEGGVEIGDGTIFGPEVVIYSSTHEYSQDRMLPYSDCDEARPVRIGRGVWLGHHVLVAPGTVIGDGVVAGMGAVLTGTIPAGGIVAGNPARVVNSRDPELLMRLIGQEAYYMKFKAEQGFSRKLIQND